MVLGLEMTPSTVVLLAIIIVLFVLAIRRMWRYGLCDCHKGTDMERGKKDDSSPEPASAASCTGFCAGCNGCAAMGQMIADMQQSADGRR